MDDNIHCTVTRERSMDDNNHCIDHREGSMDDSKHRETYIFMITTTVLTREGSMDDNSHYTDQSWRQGGRYERKLSQY